MSANNLSERLFNFAVRVLKYLTTLPNTPEFKVIRYQLAKSATSTGANYEEAQAGSSRADFSNKTNISLKEMRESNYWLRIIKETVPKKLLNEELECLVDESKQLKNILGSIVSKTNTRQK
ncbi:MAG: four helix bundle protein [Marinilabiliales bacterium]|nr:MAG: four helix bundle protein [Marinilabiliales bacterium]